jgi:hypothetical protein
MKKQIEETLHCLTGHPFWGAGRAGNLLTFQFGPRQMRTNRQGKSYEVGIYALHVQCAWHLAEPQRLLAASGDLYYKSDNVNEEMRNYDGEVYALPKAEISRLDERLFHFFQQHEKTPLLVQAIRADDLGGLTIELSDHHRLVVFPDTSQDEECWRFFQPGVDLPHFVVTGQGIEDQEE